VSSLVSRASSAGLFCLLRPKPNNEAMLSGNGAERRSRGDVGDEDVKGCDLQPGPDRSYLAGAVMRCIDTKQCLRVKAEVRCTGPGAACLCCVMTMMQCRSRG
jgi:hypothetical protein